VPGTARAKHPDPSGSSCNCSRDSPPSNDRLATPDPSVDRCDKVLGGGSFPAAELLIDCEEDRTLRAVLVGMLREDERR
jgi:hypothetical protein